MGYLFEMDHQQQMVLYTEGNEIAGVRLPLRRGGEFSLRTGYLSDLTAVQYAGMIRFAWHSLEHHVILSGTDERSDRIILSDPVNARVYGGLRLSAYGEELWLFYTGKDPGDAKFHGYMQKLEPVEEEVRELPGEFPVRPVLEPVSAGTRRILIYGKQGEEMIFQLENGTVSAMGEEDGRVRELEEQLDYAQNQYEELRQITLRLQEDGRRMRDYIRERKSGRRP